MESGRPQIYEGIKDIIINSTECSQFILKWEPIAKTLLNTRDYEVAKDPEAKHKRVVKTLHHGKLFKKSYTEPAGIKSLVDRWTREGSGDPAHFAEVMDSFELNLIAAQIRDRFNVSKQFGTFNSSTSSSGYTSPSTTSESLIGIENGFSQSVKIGNGNIRYIEDFVLGEGSDGTKVVKGFFGKNAERAVAIKTISVIPCNAQKVETEIEILLDCDEHDNIVKYHGKEKEKSLNRITYFIALEMCNATLKEWVQNRGKCSEKLGVANLGDFIITPVEILHQISKGLNYLHGRPKPIIHRDLKPENILLKRMGNGEIKVKLTDFGISRVIPEGKTHATLHTSSGTFGWMAPEILALRFQPGVTKMTRETDIFSLGCVFYYVLSNGRWKPPCMKDLAKDPTQNYPNGYLIVNPELFPNPMDKVYGRLISMMMSFDHERRPSITSILHHHLFWNNEKRLQFLIDVSNSCTPTQWQEVEEWLKLNHEELTQHPDANFSNIFASDSKSGWLDSITAIVRKDVMKYNGKSVRELVRAIRNLRVHFKEKPQKVQEELGCPPDAFLKYWLNKFPHLIDLIWTAFQMVDIAEIKTYYKNIDVIKFTYV